MSDSAVQKQKSNHIDDVTNNMRRRFAPRKLPPLVSGF